MTAKIALDKYFFALLFFQVVVDVFQNQQQLRKKQGQSGTNRERNGTNCEEKPKNQGESLKQGKKPHYQVQNGKFVNPLRIVRMILKRKSFQTTQV